MLSSHLFKQKTSAKFNAADMGSFIFGVDQFFKSALNMSQNLSFNDEVQQKNRFDDQHISTNYQDAEQS